MRSARTRVFQRNGCIAPSGFTLIELLVVLAIIAILASLLFPAVARAKFASLNARCKGNLRQLGIAMAVYADDNGAYPYSLDWEARQFWYDYLLPYYSSNKKLLACPAFRGEPNVDAAVFWLSPGSFLYRPIKPGFQVGGVSYGMNGYGLNSTMKAYRDNGEVLGIGPARPLEKVFEVKPGVFVTNDIAPINTSRVRQPSDMIFAADSMYPPVEGSFTFTYLLAVGDGSAPSPDRHNGGSNIVFGDGHSQNIRNSKLIEDSNAARRRWNNDNEPHFEFELPKLP